MPESEVYTQTIRDVTPAPESDRSGPQRFPGQENPSCDPGQRLDRLEHIIGSMREAQLQEISRKERAHKARRRREKPRQETVFALNQQTEFPSTMPVPTPAQIRRDRFPPKPRRRTERTILYDQIRRRTQANGRSGPTAGNRHAEGPVKAGAQRPRQSKPVTLIKIYIRQRWHEVPFLEEHLGRNSGSG
jgi:hypothetical protein